MGKKTSNTKKIPLLDLHGVREDEVFDAIELFFSRHQGSAQIKIMTGKGKGIVQAKTIEYLRLAHYHWQEERDAQGRTNPGVLIVFME